MPDLDEQRDQAEHALLVARAQAIGGYSAVEQALSGLLATLLNVNQQKANIIFYRLRNVQGRNEILQDLISESTGITYEDFFGSVCGKVRNLDGRRNTIVHWHKSIEVSANGVNASLTKPMDWFAPKEPSRITLSDLYEFWIEAQFYSRIIGMFDLYLLGKLDPDKHNAWLDIFRHKVVYPPSHTHPLAHWCEEQRDRLLPSQE
jgi:hypothetical protein